MDLKGFTTKAVHGALLKKDVHGALRMPIYESVAFGFETSEGLEAAFRNRGLAHTYSRITNPTVEDFEARIKLLTGAQAVLALSSGMAAISMVLMTLAESGKNVVTTRFLFGNTVSLFEKTLKPWGLIAKYVDFGDLKSVERAIDGDTRAVFLENITNPQLQVADVSAVAKVADAKGVPLIVDGTLTTPYLFHSKDHGAAVEILSSTKYISGGATSVGGLIIDNGTFDWSRSPRLKEAAAQVGKFALLRKLRQEVYRNLGPCMSPHNAALQTLGLETLALRIEKSCANALAFARHLKTHPRVKAVAYPGLPDHPGYSAATRQFNGRYGGILTFDLKTKEACFSFMDKLALIKRATNLNDNKTLIIHPASTIFCDYSDAERAQMGVPQTLMRLSVGIEDLEDLEADLNQALEASG